MRTIVLELVRDSHSTVRGALIRKEIGQRVFLVGPNNRKRKSDKLLANLGHSEVRNDLIEEFRLILE